jgi:hypothetical protein
MLFSPFTHHLIPLRPKYPPQPWHLKHEEIVHMFLTLSCAQEMSTTRILLCYRLLSTLDFGTQSSLSFIQDAPISDLLKTLFTTVYHPRQ